MLLLAGVAKDLSLVDPDLYADLAVGGIGLGKTVVDVRTKRLKRNGALMIVLCSRDLGAGKTSGAGDLDTLCTHSHGALDSELHCAPEGSSSLKLLCDALRNELCVDVGVLYLNDVDNGRHTDHCLKLKSELLYLGTASADDDTGLCAVKKDSYAVVVTLDLDLRHAGLSVLVLEKFSDFVVGDKSITEVFVLCEPS